MKEKRAILVVSFGTSHADTRKKTLDAIEEDFAERFHEATIYRAWTSRMIRKKLLETEGTKVFSVEEALEQIAADGHKKLVIQPTHILKGLEYDSLLKAVEEWKETKEKEVFESLIFSEPLIGCDEDLERGLNAVVKELAPKQDAYLVLMGHGTAHQANELYERANLKLKELGFDHVFIGTVEGTPEIDEILERVKADPRGLKKVKLAPFLMVAGDHAKNDLSGDDEDSWKNIFKNEGYETECILRGLGEYSEIREILLNHTEKVFK